MSNRKLTNGGVVSQRAIVGGSDHALGAAAPPDLSTTIAEIRRAHRDRKFTMSVRVCMENKLGSYLRGLLGWSLKLPKARQKKIKATALAAIDTGRRVIKRDAKLKEKPNARYKPVKGEADPFFVEFRGYIIGTLAGLATNNAIEDHATAEMDRLSRLLPVAPWFLENIFSTSALQLGVIIGECGDLTTWPDGNKMTVSQMRKRLALAPFTKDGVTRAGSSWRRIGGLSKDDWIRAGYNQERRSLIYVIGDLLIKKKGLYRDIYLKRKKDEMAKAAAQGLTVRPSKSIPKGRESEFISKKQIHLRAQRYMEQRVAKHVFLAWRRAIATLVTRSRMPAATLSAQAERSAMLPMGPSLVLPSAVNTAVKAVRGGHLVRVPREDHASPLLSAKADKPRASRCVTPSSVLPGANNSGKPERRGAKFRVKANGTLPRAALKPVAAKVAKRKAAVALKPKNPVPSASTSTAGRPAGRRTSSFVYPNG